MVDDALTSSPRYHHGNLPEALVAAAHDLIKERGMAALTLRAVAKRVGVTHAAPYRHFKDKAALLAAVGVLSLAELSACLRAEPDLAHAAAAYVRYATTRAASYDAIFFVSIQPPIEAIFRDLHPAHDARVSACVWSLCHGLAVLVNNGQLDTQPPAASPAELAMTAARSLA